MKLAVQSSRQKTRPLRRRQVLMLRRRKRGIRLKKMSTLLLMQPRKPSRKSTTIRLKFKVDFHISMLLLFKVPVSSSKRPRVIYQFEFSYNVGDHDIGGMHLQDNELHVNTCNITYLIYYIIYIGSIHGNKLQNYYK